MIQQSTYLLFFALLFPNVGLQWLDLEKNQVISPYVTNILVYVYFIDFVDWKKNAYCSTLRLFV